jgi:hypothetical protein
MGPDGIPNEFGEAVTCRSHDAVGGVGACAGPDRGAGLGGARNRDGHGRVDAALGPARPKGVHCGSGGAAGGGVVRDASAGGSALGRVDERARERRLALRAAAEALAGGDARRS